MAYTLNTHPEFSIRRANRRRAELRALPGATELELKGRIADGLTKLALELAAYAALYAPFPALAELEAALQEAGEAAALAAEQSLTDPLWLER